MKEKEVKFINQIIFYHKDEIFVPGGTLRVSLSTRIEYSELKKVCYPANINFTIFHMTESLNKSHNFGIHEITYLINSLKELMDAKNIVFQSSNHDSPIEVKHTSGDKSIKLVFRQSKTLENYVVITLVQGSDRLSCGLPEHNFRTLYDVLKSYISNYIPICIENDNKGILLEIAENAEIMRSLLEKLPSSLVSIGEMNSPKNKKNHTNIEELKSSPEKEEDLPPWDESNDSTKENNRDEILKNEIRNEEYKLKEIIENKSSEFKSFEIVSKDVSNDSEEQYVEISSLLVENVLEKKLNNLEDIVSNCFITDNPIQTFSNLLSEKIGLENITPGITTKDKKAIQYIGKFFHHKTLSSILNGGKKIRNVPMIYYNVPNTNTDSELVELSYDFLTIVNYLSIFNSKMMSKSEDREESKFLFLQSLRLLSEYLYVGVLRNVEPDKIKKCVMNRYIYFEKIGFFKSFDDVLENYNSKVTTTTFKSQLVSYVNNLLLSDSPPINYFYETCYEKLTMIPYDNVIETGILMKEIFWLDLAKFLEVEVDASRNISDEAQIIYSKLLNKKEKSDEGAKKKKVKKLEKNNNGVIDAVINLIEETEKKEEIDVSVPFPDEDDTQEEINSEKETYKLAGRNSQKLTDGNENSPFILKYVRKNIDDVPEEARDKFLKILEENYDDPASIKESELPFQDFGKNIVMALYIWGTFDQDDFISYKEFKNKIKHCSLPIDNILSSYFNIE